MCSSDLAGSAAASIAVSLSSSASSDDHPLVAPPPGQLADAGAPGTASDQAAKMQPAAPAPAPPAPPTPLAAVDPELERVQRAHTFLNTAPLQSN